jgi:CRP-like cAMP-binding protein
MEDRRVLHTTPSNSKNHLLASLSAADFNLIRHDLEPVTLPRQRVLVAPEKAIESVYFLESGLASTVAESDTPEAMEVIAIGREGMSGSCVVLGADRSPHKTFMQVEGDGLRLATGALKLAIARSPQLHAILLQYVNRVMTGLAESVVSAGRRSVQERLARWLLMCQDRLESDHLPLTHDFLASMLGVRRPGVTVALHMLEGEHAIRSDRADVIVLDRTRLETLAAGAYTPPEYTPGGVTPQFRTKPDQKS